MYRCDADGAPIFVQVAPPITRLLKMLTLRRVLIEKMGQTYLAHPDVDVDGE